MTNNPHPTDESGFLRSLSNFLAEDDAATSDEIADSLRAEGVDVTTLLIRAEAVLQKERQARLEQRKLIAAKERAEFFQRFNEAAISLPDTIDGLKKLINEFISGGHGQVMQQAALVQLHKYEKASESDLRLLAEHLLRLKAMAEKPGE